MVYDLEERTFQFAKAVRLVIKKMPKTIANQEDGRQLIRASGSIGANYREANDALSKKDFLMRLKISRKESKESAYWLRLIYETQDCPMNEELKALYQEVNELRNIFTAILNKSN